MKIYTDRDGVERTKGIDWAVVIFFFYLCAIAFLCRYFEGQQT